MSRSSSDNIIKNAPMVALKELLQPINRPEVVQPDKTYRILGAHWYATGLYIKDIKPGSGIQADKIYRIEEGDFVYNRLFAWKGSFAVATEANHNCYVSNEFPAFKINTSRIHPIYLWKYFTRGASWNEALGLSSGGTPTSRNRLKEEKLLAMQIPLPPLTEQHRIVTRIEAMVAKIEQARGLRSGAEEQANNILSNTAYNLFHDLEQQKNTHIFPLKVIVKILGGGTPSKSNYEFWQGTIPWVSPKDMKSTYIYDAEDHISNLALTSGATNLIPANSVLLVARSGILRRTIPVAINKVAVTINQDMKALIPLTEVTSDFIFWWFKGKEKQLLEYVKGGTTVQSLIWDKVINTPIAIPSLQKQNQIITQLNKMQSQIHTLKQHQAQTCAEIDALIPSILDKAFKGEL